jgi:hypothetical protein
MPSGDRAADRPEIHWRASPALLPSVPLELEFAVLTPEHPPSLLRWRTGSLSYKRDYNGTKPPVGVRTTGLCKTDRCMQRPVLLATARRLVFRLVRLPSATQVEVDSS